MNKINEDILRENEKLEFKSFVNIIEQKEINKKILEVIIAFANTKGGSLIIGINDKTKEIEEQPDFLIKWLNDNVNLMNIIRDKLNQNIVFNIKKRKSNKKDLYVIEIEKSDKPIWIIGNKNERSRSYIRLNGQIKTIDTFSNFLTFLIEKKYELIEISEVKEWNKHIINLFEKIFIGDYYDVGYYRNHHNKKSNRLIIIEIINKIRLFDKKKVKKLFSDVIKYLEQLKKINKSFIPDVQIKILDKGDIDIDEIFNLLTEHYYDEIENSSILKYTNLKLRHFKMLFYWINKIDKYNKTFKGESFFNLMLEKINKIEVIKSAYDKNFNKNKLKSNLIKMNDFQKEMRENILKISKNKINYFYNFDNDNKIFEPEILKIIYVESLFNFLHLNHKSDINLDDFFSELKNIDFQNKIIDDKEFILFQNMLLTYKIIYEIFSINFTKHSNSHSRSGGIENFLNNDWIFYIYNLKLIKDKYIETFIMFFQEKYFKILNKNFSKEINIFFNNMRNIWHEINLKYFLYTHDINNNNMLKDNVKRAIFNLLESFSYTPTKYMEINSEKIISFKPNTFFSIDKIKMKVEKLSIFDEKFWSYIKTLFKNKKSEMLDKSLTNDGDFLLFDFEEIKIKNIEEKYKLIYKIDEFINEKSLIKDYVIKYCNEKYKNDWAIKIEDYYLGTYWKVINFLNRYEKILFLINDYKERLFELYNSDESIKINLNLSIEDFLKDYYEDINDELNLEKNNTDKYMEST